MRFAKTLTALATLLALGLPAQAGDSVGPGEEIILGSTTPLTGPAGIIGQATAIGFRLAQEAINDKGGINGRKIKIVVLDDEYVPATTLQNLQKMLDSDGIFAFFPTTGGSQINATMEVINDEKLPTYIVAVTTMSHFIPPKPTVFGIGMPYDRMASNLVKFINGRTPGLKWASIVQDDESGIAREDGVKQGTKEAGLELALAQRFKRGQVDYSTEVQQVKASGATALMLGGLPPGNAAMAKEAKKLGMNVVMAMDHASHIPPAIGLMGEAGDGIYVVDIVPPFEDAKMAPFNALVAKFLQPADAAKLDRFSVLAYENVMLFAKAAESCGADLTRDCVNAFMNNLKTYETQYMGPISFNNGERLARIDGFFMQIDAKEKRFSLVK